MAVKKVLAVALAGIGVLALAVGVNTARSGSKQLAVAPVAPLQVDEGAAAQRLGESLRFVTISDARDADANAAEFDKLHAPTCKPASRACTPPSSART